MPASSLVVMSIGPRAGETGGYCSGACGVLVEETEYAGDEAEYVGEVGE